VAGDGNRPRLVELELGGSPEPWAALGFRVDADGAVRIGGVALRWSPSAGPGIQGWTLMGAAGDGPIDGLPTRRLPAGKPPPAEDSPPGDPHPNSAVGLDHVVAMTPDLDRTFAALEAAGLELRRVREAGKGLRQGFFRLGPAILEVAGDVEPAGPARFWGMVAVVADLDAAAEHLGDRLGTPKDAVQPGRRIATVREAAGLGVPLALMTPRPR
jgi:hypothetical protein